MAPGSRSDDGAGGALNPSACARPAGAVVHGVDQGGDRGPGDRCESALHQGVEPPVTRGRVRRGGAGAARMARMDVLQRYEAADGRYDAMTYRRCGRSGLDLPGRLARPVAQLRRRRRRWSASAPCCAGRSTSASRTSTSPTTTARRTAAPRRTSGASSRQDFRPYRDELVISTKAGYDMWPGPYGDRGSRKYLLSSLDQSLKRMGLDYVDIFYSHRFDPRDAAGGDDGGARHRRPLRPRPLRRHLLVLPGAHPAGGRDPAVDGHAAADPPAELLDAQPVGGARVAEPARRAGRGGRRLHRLLAARPGHAHRPLPRRRARGVAGRAGQVARPLAAHRGVAGARAPAQRDRPRARPEPGPARPAVGAARRAGDVGARSARAACASWRRTWRRSTGRRSPTSELAAIDQDAVDSGINLWEQSSLS